MSDWERCASYIEASIANDPYGWTLDEVRREVESGRALFWPGGQSAAVTDAPKDFRLWIAGGKLDELAKMEAAACEFARAAGFERMTAEQGRKGWERWLRPLGYRAHRILVKEL